MTLIQITTGSETHRQGSAKYHAFVVPTRHMDIPKEVFLDVMARHTQKGIRRLSLTKTPAVSGSMVDMGTWFTGTYDIPDGTLLKIFGSLSMSGAAYGASQGRRIAASLFLSPRRDGPLHRVSCRLVGAQNASMDRLTIEGRFDLVTMQDAARLYGAQINPMTAAQFMPERQAHLFTVETLDQQVRSAPTVAVETVRDEDGATVEVAVPKRRRALDLDD